MSLKAKIYLTTTSLLGLFLIGNQIITNRLNFEDFGLALIILAVASFFAEIYELEIVPRWSITTGIAMAVSSIYIGGAPLAIMVMLLSSLPAEIILRWDNLKTNGFLNFLFYIFFNIGQLGISIIVAAYVFTLLGGPKPPYDSFQAFGALFLTFIVYEVVNAILVSIGIAFTTTRKLSYSLRYSLKYLHLHFLTLGIISILISLIYHWEPENPANLLFVFIPLGLAHFSMRNYLRLRHDSHNAFMLVVNLIEKRDRYTGEHSEDVTSLAALLARALNLSDEMTENIEMGAAIHDIGKIAIPDAILHKDGPLSEQEWEKMKEHPTVGAEILGQLEIYKDVVPIVRHEHERWGGGGYPDGIKGEAIPLGARVVAVVDVYSALTTPRPYRLAQGKPLIYTHEEACEILNEMAGKALDPTLVEVFLHKAELGERIDAFIDTVEVAEALERAAKVDAPNGTV